MKPSEVPAASMPTATNCAEPANTMLERPMVCQMSNPALSDNVPKIMPKGTPPTIRGSASNAPLKKRPNGVSVFEVVTDD